MSIKDKLASRFYGPHIHSQVCYWKFDLGLSFGKIQKLFLDQYNMHMSRSTLSCMVSRSSKKFKSAYEDIKVILSEQGHLHADETSWRVSGDNHWLWNFSNEDFSFYKVDPTRSQEVVKNILGETFDGVLVTDFYGGYNKINSLKQKCWVHLLRELHELKEKHPKDEQLKKFASRIKRFFERGKKIQFEYEEKKDISSKLKRLIKDTDTLISQNYKNSNIMQEIV